MKVADVVFMEEASLGPSRVRAYLVGDGPPATLLRSMQEGTADVVAYADMAGALSAIASGHPLPDLVVLHLRVADGRQLQALAELRRLAPLVRIVLCGGPWCYRRLSRWLSCGIDRIFSETDCAVGLPRYLAQLADPQLPLPPFTASVDERLAWEVDAGRNLPGRSQAVGVVAASRESRLLLEDVCRANHYQVTAHRDLDECAAARPAVILWETRCWDTQVERELKQFRDHQPDAPVVVLFGLARQADLASAHTAGANACLEKPFLIADLLWLVDVLCRADAAVPSAAQQDTNVSQAERDFLLAPVGVSGSAA